MTVDCPIVLDACVLANFPVCDLFLRLAEMPRLYVPRWSTKILEEVARTQLDKLGWPERLVESWRREVTRAFPDCGVEGYEDWIPHLTNHEKDRHVLAAAIQTEASVIATYNLRDFPSDALDKWQIKALHPQDVLLTFLSWNHALVMEKLSSIANDRHQTIEDVVVILSQTMPLFGAKVLEA